MHQAQQWSPYPFSTILLMCTNPLPYHTEKKKHFEISCRRIGSFENMMPPLTQLMEFSRSLGYIFLK